MKGHRSPASSWRPLPVIDTSEALRLERCSHTHPAAALYAHHADPRIESIELDAHLVRPFGNIRDRHRSLADHASIKQHLCASRTRRDHDRATESRGRSRGRRNRRLRLSGPRRPRRGRRNGRARCRSWSWPCRGRARTGRLRGFDDRRLAHQTRRRLCDRLCRLGYRRCGFAGGCRSNRRCGGRCRERRRGSRRWDGDAIRRCGPQPDDAIRKRITGSKSCQNPNGDQKRRHARAANRPRCRSLGYRRDGQVAIVRRWCPQEGWFPVGGRRDGGLGCKRQKRIT